MIIIIEIAGESKNLCKHKFQAELRQAEEEEKRSRRGEEEKSGRGKRIEKQKKANLLSEPS